MKTKKTNQNTTNVIAFRVKTVTKAKALKKVQQHELDGLSSISEAGQKLFEAWIDGEVEWKKHRFVAKEK